MTRGGSRGRWLRRRVGGAGRGRGQTTDEDEAVGILNWVGEVDFGVSWEEADDGR